MEKSSLCFISSLLCIQPSPRCKARYKSLSPKGVRLNIGNWKDKFLSQVFQTWWYSENINYRPIKQHFTLSQQSLGISITVSVQARPHSQLTQLNPAIANLCRPYYVHLNKLMQHTSISNINNMCPAHLKSYHNIRTTAPCVENQRSASPRVLDQFNYLRGFFLSGNNLSLPIWWDGVRYFSFTKFLLQCHTALVFGQHTL